MFWGIYKWMDVWEGVVGGKGQQVQNVWISIQNNFTQTHPNSTFIWRDITVTGPNIETKKEAELTHEQQLSQRPRVGQTMLYLVCLEKYQVAANLPMFTPGIWTPYISKYHAR